MGGTSRGLHYLALWSLVFCVVKSYYWDQVPMPETLEDACPDYTSYAANPQ